MTRLAGFEIPGPPLLALPLFLAALLLVALLAERGIARLTARWFGDDAPRLSIPIAGAVLIGGSLLVAPEVPLPGRAGRWLYVALTIAFVLACAMVLARVAVASVTSYAGRHPSVSPALGVARVAVRLTVGILAVITALESLGVPVAPLLTTLGVSSLAVALALQETLANFFAGLYLLADRPVRAGDYIKIHDGEEGYVEAIGWRSSRLRTLKNNVVIVPNQKLSQAILTNFHLPAPPVGMSVTVTVPYDADAARVEAELTDELQRAAAEIPDVQPNAGAPVVRITNLSDAGLVFELGVQVRTMEAQAAVGHEIRKRIVARLRKAGVDIALPQRVIRDARAAVRHS